MTQDLIIDSRLREQIGLFIDGPHLFEAARTLGLYLDYGKLLKYFQDQGDVVQANFYGAVLPDRDNTAVWGLFDWLTFNGYKTLIRSAQLSIDAQGAFKAKSSLSIDIAFAMNDMANRLDHIVLFSGLGRLSRAVQAVQRKGVRVTVVSTIRSPSPMAAILLRRLADQFVDLVDLAPYITREKPRLFEDVV